MVPIPLEYTKTLIDAEIIPIGLAFQKPINAKGEIIDKERLTHDLSFLSESGTSINDRTIDNLLSECVYGQCLRRVLHRTNSLRSKYPTTEILLAKFDLDAAYRRLHSHPKLAVKAIIIVDEMAYILNRLPFGAAAGPSIYSTVSEMIFDLANDLVNDKNWNPEKLHSPHSEKLAEPQHMEKYVEFEIANDLFVHIPEKEVSYNGYIDDEIMIALEKLNNARRGQEAVPVTVHGIFRPLDKIETARRNDPLSLRKLSGEGTPCEQKVVLGWLICTRSFRIFLQQEKVIYWTDEIDELLKWKGRIKANTLEKMIGKFNHLAFIIPHARYFLNRLRFMCYKAEKYGPQHLNERVKEDLILWRKFLTQSSQI